MSKTFTIVKTTNFDFNIETKILGVFDTKKQATDEFNAVVAKHKELYADEIKQVEDGGYIIEESNNEWMLYKDGRFAENGVSIFIVEVELNKSITNV